MKIRLCFIAALLCLPLWQAAGQSRFPDGRASAQRPSPYRPLLTCSPAPCVLPPTLASEGTSWIGYAPIAVNPDHPAELIVGSDDGNCGEFTQLGFQVSNDGGSTWSTTCMGYLNEFGKMWQNGGFPLVGYDLKGSAYIAGYYQWNFDLNYNSVIGLEKSIDGVNWSEPISALGTGSSEIDYASLAVDQSAGSPYANSVYVLGVNDGPVQVLVSRSRDGGTTWNTAQVAADGPHQFTLEYDPDLVIGEDGTLYAAWLHCDDVGEQFCTNNEDYMLFSKSGDGGVTWSRPRFVTSVREVPGQCGGCFPFGFIPNTNVPTLNTPALGVDNSSGPYAGRLYASLYEWTGTQMRVVVIHSTDGGTTWSEPVPVAPRGETHDQFFPWLSVSPAGLVGVSWFDRRNDPANVDYQAYAAISSDGGETFQPNVQLTAAFSNPNDTGYNSDQNFLGYYAGNTWDGPNYFIAAWMDTSDGINSQDVVGGIRLK
jgi:hypothetical protein